MRYSGGARYFYGEVPTNSQDHWATSLDGKCNYLRLCGFADSLHSDNKQERTCNAWDLWVR